MSSRNSIHDFIMLLPALLLVGWLVLVIILMFRMINVTKLTVKVRFPNLFVSILNARHFEKPILRDSMSNIQKYNHKNR